MVVSLSPESPVIRFSLGRVLVTQGAKHFLSHESIPLIALLRRHVAGDWGDISEHDRQINDLGVALGGQLLSSYSVGSGRVWVITTPDRSYTTILLPEEY